MVVNYRDNLDNNKQKSARFPMVSYNDYMKDKQCFVARALLHYKQIVNRILPARQIGCSVTNFKAIEFIKQ